MTIQMPGDFTADQDSPEASRGALRGLGLLGPRAGLASSPVQVGGDFVFIDARVPDIQDLINGAKPGERVFVIDSEHDGLSQIANILAASHAQSLSSISIVSHGSVGEVEVGSTILNDATLSAHADTLSAIGAALKAGGDLNLFACDTAQGATGQQFIGDLSSYLGGADVAAATHTVGSADHGGSFLLDSATGAIDSAVPFTDGAISAFDGSLAGTVSGQVWFGGNGGGASSTVGHVNSDASNPTQQGNESDPGEVQAKSVGIDLAAGFYFQTDDTTNRSISSYNYITGNVISTVGIGSLGGPGTGDDDIVNALAVDPEHNTVYVGRWGATSALSGIVKLTYNPTTGVLDPTAAASGTPNFIVHGNTGIDDIRGMAVDPVNQVIYFTTCNDSFNTGGFSYTNALWRVNQDGTGLVQMTTAGQFPASVAGSQAKAIGPVAYDAAKGLVYFETSDIHTGGTGAATLWAIAANASGGTATAVTLPGGTVLAYGDTPQGGLTLDPQNQQLYIVEQTNGIDGAAVDQMLVGQLSANGLSITSFVQTYSYQTLDGQPHTANEHLTGASFDTLPILSITGTTTHAVEQSASIVLPSSNSSSDVDSNHYASATVQITGGTFTSNENSSADDHLTINGASSGTVAGTNITLSYNSATETLTLSGYDTTAHYDAALALVKYNTTGDNPTNYGANTSRSITWTVSDGALNVPVNQQNSGITTLNVDGVNDATTLANGATITYTEQNAGATIATGITVADPDNLNEASATVVISAGFQTGDVLAANVAGTSITANYVAGTHTLTLSGSDTLAHYQQVLRTVTFQNSTNDDPTAGGTDLSRTIQFTTNDGTADPLHLSNTLNSTINVTAVNDAPIAVAPLAHYAATEQVVLSLKNTGISVSDVDSGTGSETLTLSVVEGAVSGTVGTSGATLGGSGTSSMTISGTIAQINAFLNTDGTSTVTYTDGSDTPAASTTLSVSINDNGNTGTGGSLIGSASSTIDITAVNDAPGAVAPVAHYSATEQSLLSLKSSGLSVSDVDGGSGSETLTLSVGEGTLTAAAGTSGASIGGSGTSSLTISGTIAQINAFLNTDGTSTLSYLDNTDTPSASTTLSLSINDNGHTGTGGALTGTATATIDITAVNDAPTAFAPLAHYAATEQVALSLKNTGISVSDVDSGSGSETLTLSVGEGTIVGTVGTSGATLGGSGTSSMTISGTIAQINAFLNTDGTSTLTYTDGSDTPAASTTLSVSINDNGNTGTGGSLTSSASSIIDITAVNDVPVVVMPVAHYSATEQTSLDLKNSGLSVSDVDSGGNSETLTINVGEGTLSATSGTSGVSVSGSGTATLILNGTIAQLNAFLNTDGTSTLTYIDNTDTPSASTSLALSLNDLGSTGTGGAQVGSATGTIDITAVDDPGVGQPDAFTVAANALLNTHNLFADNGSGVDTDPDGPALAVTQVNGSAGNIGVLLTLGSGAHLTVNANGTFTYDPNHAFDTLAAVGSGAANTTATDSFTYEVNGSADTTVTITIDGHDSASTVYVGDATHTTITGGNSGNLFDLTTAANYNATGGAGNDGFKFEGTFDAGDHVNGGGGTNNQVGLEGDYSGNLTLTGAMLTNIQVVAMLPGFDYKFTTDDTLVPLNQTLTFWSVSMGALNHVDIDGHAETNGNFRFLMGAGDDIATGGAGADQFTGNGGQDTLKGNGGADTFAYLKPADSTGNANGTAYDKILDFTHGVDKFDLPVAVTGINTAITHGTLDAAAFDTDLASVIGAGQLGLKHAVLFTPDGGSLAGHTFLIVDANGTAGYQPLVGASGDYVFDVTGGTNLASLSTGDFI